MKYLYLTLSCCFLALCIANAQSPTTHSTDLTVDSLYCNRMAISWDPGNGSDRIVVITEGASSTFVPKDQTNYSANDVLQKHFNGYWQVVYDGNGSSTVIKGLMQNTKYSIAIFEYSSSPSPDYLTTGNYLIDSTVTEGISGDYIVNQGLQCLSGNEFSYLASGSNTSGDDLKYLWRFSDNSTSESKSPVHVYEEGGLQRVQLEISSTGCKVSVAKYDTVVVPFITQFELNQSIQGNDSVQCLEGNQFNFSSTSYPPPITFGFAIDRTNYLFKTSDSQRMYNPFSEFSFMTEGVYKITLITARRVGRMGAPGCVDSASMYVRVALPDSITLNVNPRDLCTGGDSLVTFVHQGADTTNVIWRFSDGDSSSLRTVVRTYKDAGVYPFKLTERKGDCPYVYTDSIRVLSQSDIDLGKDSTIKASEAITLQTQQNDLKYLWSTGDTTNKIKLRGQDLGLGTHKIWVKVEIDNNCSYSDTIEINVISDLSVVEPLYSPIGISPNPGNNDIQLFSQQPPSYIAIWDIQGRKLMELDPTMNVHDVASLESGTYYFEIRIEDQTYDLKWIKN